MLNGITKYISFILLLSIFFLFICLPVLCETTRISEKQYWTDQSNIVASVSAYERLVPLHSGQSVPVYDVQIDDLLTNYNAIIFYVIAPEEHRGKFFRLNSIPAEFGSGFIPPSYHIDKLYYFPFVNSTDEESRGMRYWTGISSKDLFTIPEAKPGRLNVGKTNGEVYYASIQEANDVLIALEKEHDRMDKRLKSLTDEIDEIKRVNKNVNNDLEYKRLRRSYIELQMESLPSNEYKQVEVKKQIEKMMKLDKIKNL